MRATEEVSGLNPARAEQVFVKWRRNAHRIAIWIRPLTFAIWLAYGAAMLNLGLALWQGDRVLLWTAALVGTWGVAADAYRRACVLVLGADQVLRGEHGRRPGAEK